MMLNSTSLLADALGRNLAETYRRIFGGREPEIASALDEAARLVIERIASSDALYHDCEHTALVTLCVQDILRGRRLERTMAPLDWGHIMVRERFAPVPFIDGERIAAAIELTRFPVPNDDDHAATDSEAALVRAGDLIGQLGDPFYPRKLNALYQEFAEI